MIYNLLKNYKKVTIIELIVVIAVIIALILFSLFLLTSPNYWAVPANFHIWRNFVEMKIICSNDKDYCNEIQYCDLNFWTWFFEEIDDDSISQINGNLDLSVYKNKFWSEQCETRLIRNYNLKDLQKTLLENNWWEDYYYIINWIFYNSTFNKINWIFDRTSGIRIMDGIIYF